MSGYSIWVRHPLIHFPFRPTLLPLHTLIGTPPRHAPQKWEIITLSNRITQRQCIDSLGHGIRRKPNFGRTKFSLLLVGVGPSHFGRHVARQIKKLLKFTPVIHSSHFSENALPGCSSPMKYEPAQGDTEMIRLSLIKESTFQ